MPKLIFVDSEGTEKSVEAENGLSVMEVARDNDFCLLYTSPSPRDRTRSRMPSSA